MTALTPVLRIFGRRGRGPGHPWHMIHLVVAESADPAHPIPSLGLMSVTAWVKRRQGGCRPQTFGLKRLSSVNVMSSDLDRPRTKERSYAGEVGDAAAFMLQDRRPTTYGRLTIS